MSVLYRTSVFFVDFSDDDMLRQRQQRKLEWITVCTDTPSVPLGRHLFVTLIHVWQQYSLHGSCCKY